MAKTIFTSCSDNEICRKDPQFFATESELESDYFYSQVQDQTAPVFLINHCTIGYAMKIKKKKMFKSKHLVFAHFSTKTGDFFGIDGKIPMFCHKYFLKSKM